MPGSICAFFSATAPTTPYSRLKRIRLCRGSSSPETEENLSSFLTFPPFPFEAEFEEQSVKFLALHGHRPVNVKGSLVAAASYAASKGADVLLYGHTHIKDDRTVETASGSVRMINPGSAGRGSEPSYALLTLMNGVLLCGFGETCE